MNFSASELKTLAAPVVGLVAALAAGAALIFWTQGVQHNSKQQLAAASAERAQARERLTRIADEEKEVNDKLAVYRQLKDLRILGDERRLEWADAMTRIRTGRELLDLHYVVERQRPIASIPGKPANVDFFASKMKVEIALLHEGDLLTFLRDLRDSGNAYYSMKRCNITRNPGAPTGISIIPRLRAECDIDLITILDRAAKS
jgi:hypothetical protein